MGTKAVAIPKTGSGKVIEPFQHPQPKLEMAPPDMRPWKMTPPSMSPLHMSPPNMLLPDFSPIQDHMPLPTLSASKFTPPQSFLTHQSGLPVSVIRFARADPTFLAVGTSQMDREQAANQEEKANVIIYKAEDVEREVRGDRQVVAGPANDVRVKIRPRLTEMATIRVDAGVMDIQFSPHDPTFMAITLSSGVLSFYRISRTRHTAKPLASNPIAPSPIHSFTFSPVSPTIAAAGLADGTAMILDISDPRAPPKTIHSISTSSRILSTAFSNDGKRLYTSSEDGSLNSIAVSSGKPRWQDQLDAGVNALLPWPAPGAPDIAKKRRALLAGGADGTMRVLDMSSHQRPPITAQALDLEGAVSAISQLPPLPTNKELKNIPAGSFSVLHYPDVECETEIGGVIAAAGKGGGRLLIHKQKFEEVFLPKRDGSDIVNWTTADGVRMDHEGRELQYWWYDLADIEEHAGAEVCAADAVGVVDYDPLFRDGGKQRKRRGWRVCTADREGGLVFWQVYIE